MRHRKRLCEWADLVDADLPEELACDDEGAGSTEEFLVAEESGR
ncbi:hypothetical protein [Halorientalis marina]|nr:hypothetical protein [Halorientalis marina]